MNPEDIEKAKIFVEFLRIENIEDNDQYWSIGKDFLEWLFDNHHHYCESINIDEKILEFLKDARYSSLEQQHDSETIRKAIENLELYDILVDFKKGETGQKTLCQYTSKAKQIGDIIKNTDKYREAYNQYRIYKDEPRKIAKESKEIAKSSKNWAICAVLIAFASLVIGAFLSCFITDKIEIIKPVEIRSEVKK